MQTKRQRHHDPGDGAISPPENWFYEYLWSKTATSVISRQKLRTQKQGLKNMFYGNKLIIQYNKVICERNVFMCRLKVSDFAYLESRKIL